MRAAIAIALALALVVPAAGAVDPPLPADPIGLLVRQDADGARTITLAIEDGEGGAFSYSPTHAPPQVPDVREAGTYAHTWVRDGSPMLTLGTYLVSQSQQRVRIPAVIVENVSTQAQLTALATVFANRDAAPFASNLAPFLTEFLLPELAASFGTYPVDVATYRSDPTIYVWTIHRATGAGEVWSGAYLLREGSATAPGVSPFHAEKLVEVGAAARVDDVTTRVAGVWLRSVVDGVSRESARDLVTVGSTTADARLPLASLEATDSRSGSDALLHPDAQQDGFAIGVHNLTGGFVPLVGARTTQTYSANGALGDGTTRYEVTRITSFGAFVHGDYVPVAGFRTHSDTGDVLATAAAFLRGGLGDDGAGNFEADVGAFDGDAYVPLVGAIHRDAFPRQLYAHASLVAVGGYGPFGFEGVLAASYDGSSTLVEHALAVASSRDHADAWRIAAGAYLLGSYEPVVGAQSDPADPLGDGAYQRSFTLGLFAGDYGAFVPVASASYDSPRAPIDWTATFVNGGGFGTPTGGWEENSGLHVGGAYVPLVGVQYRDEAPERAAPSEASLVVGAYLPDGTFVPLAALAYWGDSPFLTSLGALGSTTDDTNANFAAGVFVQGSFVELVTVHNDGDGTSVTPGPA